jgi:hypothetical protein
LIEPVPVPAGKLAEKLNVKEAEPPSGSEIPLGLPPPIRPKLAVPDDIGLPE